nr:MAG TPA: Putative trypsin inhibitor ATTI-2, trypsin inhibitor, chymotrypsin inhibitor [Caudoviricetes sp.]
MLAFSPDLCYTKCRSRKEVDRVKNGTKTVS